MAVLFAILLFSVLIFVHELGHFLAAKASGVQVNEFSMFMGPVIFKKQIGSTLYSLRCIPIGGFCAMEGEDEDTDSPHSFQKAAWWKRLMILVAGAAMNFLTGLLLFTIIYLPVKQVAVPVIASFEDYCTVSGAQGLQAGDEILKIDGERVFVQSDFTLLTTVNPDEYHDLVVHRNGEKVYLNHLKMEKHPLVDEQGKPVVDSSGQPVLKYGLNFGIQRLDFFGKLKMGWNETLDSVRNVRLSLQMLFTGKAGLKDMSGPVGVVDMMSDVAGNSGSVGAATLNLLWFGAFLAVNLAVMNLLPIPALDGGRVVALLLTTVIEKITGKAINPKYEGYIHGVGMILLLALMAIIMFKDIIFIFWR